MPHSKLIESIKSLKASTKWNGERLEAQQAELNRLEALLKNAFLALAKCETAMDTAAVCGVREILAPAYQESWAIAHQEARAALNSLMNHQRDSSC